MTPYSSHLDPQMASLLLMAESALAEGDFPFARQCYEKALELRPHHGGARLNLGVTLVELRCFSQALDVLDQLELDLRTDDGNGKLVELRLSGRYNAALAHWYLSFESAQTDVSHLEQALTVGRQLALDLPVGMRRRDLPADRLHVLQALEGATLALLAGIIVDAIEEGVQLAPPAASGVDSDAVGSPGSPLQTQDRPAPPWLVRLQSADWYALKTVPVLVRTVARAHKKDPRTRYNLALVRARMLRKPWSNVGEGASLPEHWQPLVDQAFADLQFAAEHDRSHVRWADRDILIKPLRHIHGERFDGALRSAATLH